jgi:hypothetical protein
MTTQGQFRSICRLNRFINPAQPGSQRPDQGRWLLWFAVVDFLP